MPDVGRSPGRELRIFSVEMKVVVTGGSGKAGRGVVAELIAQGHEVLVVDKVRSAKR